MSVTLIFFLLLHYRRALKQNDLLCNSFFFFPVVTFLLRLSLDQVSNFELYTVQKYWGQQEWYVCCTYYESQLWDTSDYKIFKGSLKIHISLFFNLPYIIEFTSKIWYCNLSDGLKPFSLLAEEYGIYGCKTAQLTIFFVLFIQWMTCSLTWQKIMQFESFHLPMKDILQTCHTFEIWNILLS
jgi:hypothetical protein